MSSEPQAPSSGAQQAQAGPSPPDLKLHPAAIAVGAVEAIVGLLLPLAAIGVATLLGGGGGLAPLISVAIYGLAAVGIAVVLGYVRWASTTYRLDADAISMRRGVLQRQQASVPVERVSSIDTVQGPVHRLLGVIELRVQAAGGGQEPEIRLQAVSQEAAAAVRRHVGGAREESIGEAVEPKVVRRLSRRALTVAALTSGQITVVLPVLAALSQSVDDLAGQGGEAEAVNRYLVPESLGEGAMLLAVLLVAAWLLAIAGTVVAFAGFTVSRDGDRVRIRRGLLQRRVSTIPVGRIQAIRVVEGLLRQPLGLVSLRVESAGYAKEASVNTALFPLLPRREVDDFLRTAVPELAAPLGPLERPPARASWIYVGRPALLGVAVGVPLAFLFSPFALALIPLAVAVGVLRRRAAGWRIGDGFLVARSRRLARTTILAAGLRLPERTYAQGPLARRLGLATLAFALASRTRWRVPHIDQARVRGFLEELSPPQQRARSIDGHGAN